MKKLSSMLVLFAFACAAATPAFSGEMKMSGEEGYHGQMKGNYDPKKSFDDFSRKLNLSKEQKEKIRPILNREVEEMKKIHEKAMRLMEEHQQKVMDHLTPQQKEKYRKMIADRKVKMEMMMKDHHGGMGEGAATEGHKSKQGHR